MKSMELTDEQSLQASIWVALMIEQCNVSGKVVLDAFRTAYSELQDLEKAKEQAEREMVRYNERMAYTLNKSSL